jgi:hypothetical protein
MHDRQANGARALRAYSVVDGGDIVGIMQRAVRWSGSRLGLQRVPVRRAIVKRGEAAAGE